VRRTYDLIAIYLADQARRLDLRRNVVRQTDVLLEIERGLLDSEIIVDAIIEGDTDKREPVKRRGTNDIDAGRRRKTHLHRDGVIALHLFGRLAGGLCGDFQNDGRRVWIGLDIQLEKGCDSRADEYEQSQQNDRPPRQSEYDKPLQHVSRLVQLKLDWSVADQYLGRIAVPLMPEWSFAGPPK
jgi:hypothetical protein